VEAVAGVKTDAVAKAAGAGGKAKWQSFRKLQIGLERKSLESFI
jgi:hypothetical protein